MLDMSGHISDKVLFSLTATLLFPLRIKKLLLRALICDNWVTVAVERRMDKFIEILSLDKSLWIRF